MAGLDAIPNHGTFKINFRPTRASVLGREPDGKPAFTTAPLGKGRVYFLAVPLEMTLAQTPGAFHAGSKPPYWRLYHQMGGHLLKRRAVRKTHGMVGLTEHALDVRSRVEVVINYPPNRLRETLEIAAGWNLKQVLHGKAMSDGRSLNLELDPNDACVMVVARPKQ